MQIVTTFGYTCHVLCVICQFIIKFVCLFASPVRSFYRGQSCVQENHREVVVPAVWTQPARTHGQQRVRARVRGRVQGFECRRLPQLAAILPGGEERKYQLPGVHEETRCTLVS